MMLYFLKVSRRREGKKKRLIYFWRKIIQWAKKGVVDTARIELEKFVDTQAAPAIFV